MSSFFGRKSSKTTTAEFERPQLVKSQSADSSRSSRSSIDNSYAATRDAANLTGKMRSSASTSALTTTSSSSASLLHKFQGERAASASGLGSSSARGREGRRKPIVVRYEQSPALDAARLQRDLDAMLLNSSVESSQRTYSVDHDADDAPFDVESAISGFMTSFSPTRDSKKSKKKSSSRSQRGSTTTTSAQHEFLMSNTLRASTPAVPSTRSRSNTLQRLSVGFTGSSGSLRSSQRAESKAKKYDVEWRNDQDCQCCQVCYAMFTKLSRRRHHCRVCGDLVCGDCSNDQVLLQGRFEAPKRACVACVTLLQVMQHNGDPRVVIEGQGSSTSSKASTASQTNSNAPLATPRYHDRLGEVQRVMVAGKKSERRGSTQTEMFVISSKWLRTWLAFTRSTDGPNNQTVDPYSNNGDNNSSNLNNSSSSAYSPNNNNNNGSLSAPPPGPIDNMPLLELSKGKLVKRPELVRDDNVGGDEADEDGGGDYQLISSEVWEVLQRLYGGGPSIRVVSDDGFRDWIVDVYALLANAAAQVAIPPTVENVLVTRHEAAVVTRASYISVEKAALISSGGYESINILSQSSRSSFNNNGGGGAVSGRSSMSGSSMKHLGEKAAASTSDRGSFSSRASQVRVRPNSPQHYEPRASSSMMRASAAKQHVNVEDASIRDSSAATAANAFAVAMKQARLNAQKAIEDRSRARTQLLLLGLAVINLHVCLQQAFCMRDLSTVTPATHEDVRVVSRGEGLRRANLYGVSSAKRLPQVQLLPDSKKDARVRKDLQLLTDRVLPHAGGDHHHHQCQVHEDELNDRKHREDLGLRPPLDQIQRLQDLFTTVAKDLRIKHASNQQQNGEMDSVKATDSSIAKREWRVGYKNNPHGGSRGPLNGMFEPPDAVRECAFVVTRDPLALQPSLAIAYPVALISPEKIASEMQPFDEEAARDAMERKTSAHCNARGGVDQEDEKGTPWCPASYLTLHDKRGKKTKTKNSLDPDLGVTQTHALRKVATFDLEKGAARARKAPLAVDDTCVKKKQSLLAKAAATYTRIREQLDRSKDPKLRYSLPVEDLSKKRAYRLGLEPVPSTFEAADQMTTAGPQSSNNNPESEATIGDTISPMPSLTARTGRLRFRPRSAAGNVPFRSSALSKSLSSSSSYNALEPAPSVGKVAGAKRRPHSASICYLKSSTVYCVDAPSSQASSYNPYQQQSSLHDRGSEQPEGADFGSVLDRERRKRHCNQDQTLVMLSKRGLFHNLPVPQVFARLRRESLKNLTRRLQYAQFEKMSMEEYMSSCGMQTTVVGDSGGSKPSTALVNQQGGALNKAVQISFTATAAVANNGGGGILPSSISSSSLLEMRKMLFVTRQQFHIALEAFNMTPSDVNLLFSALDVGVEDRVMLWEILCAVEKLQDGHAQLRRSRVQIKTRDLPKDLDLLRNSFTIPNVTHAPLEVGQASGVADS